MSGHDELRHGASPDAAGKVVLFWDIDGTLITTGRAGVYALIDAAADVLGEHDVGDRLFDLHTAGSSDWYVCKACIEELGHDATDETIRAYLASYERHLPGRLPERLGQVLPNVAEILVDLDGHPEVVNLLLTGNTPAGAEAKLSHYGIWHHFPGGGAFCVDDGDRASIARRALELARELLAGEPSPERVYVIGDTEHDVSCGKAIGVRTLAVGTGPRVSRARLEGAQPWAIVDELPEPDAFRELIGAR